MSHAIVSRPAERFAAVGASFVVKEGRGSEAREVRYLIVLTPRLDALIGELQATPDRTAHPEVYRKYESTLLE